MSVKGPAPIKATREALVGEKGFLRGAENDRSSSRVYLAGAFAFVYSWFASNLWGPWDLPFVTWPQARAPREFELVFMGAVILYLTGSAYGKDALRYVLPQFGKILERMGSGSGGGLSSFSFSADTPGSPAKFDVEPPDDGRDDEFPDPPAMGEEARS